MIEKAPYNSAVPMGKAEGKATALLARLEKILSEIGETDVRLSVLVDKIDGPRPSDEVDGSKSPLASTPSFLQRLNDITNRLDNLSGGISRSASQLEELI